MHRIALASLLFDRGRLAAALTGVAFATLLMLIQVGIYYGFGESASSIVRGVGGDVWVSAPGVAEVEQGDVLPEGTDLLLLRQPCVARARPVIVAWAPFRESGGAMDSVQLIGADPGGPRSVPWTMVVGLPQQLAGPDRVTFDEINAGVLSSPRGLLGASLEIGGREVHVAGLTHGIRNIGLNPMVFSSARTARRIAGLGRHEAHYWVADLSDPRCAPALIAAIHTRPGLLARTTAQFVESAERELLEESGVSIALGFVALLGFLVAVVIVGQTLFATLREHERELAMLKALGATPAELASFVLWQAAFLAVVGSAAGTALAFGTRGLLASLSVSVVLPPGAVAVGVASIFALCALASAGSVRHVMRLSAVELLS